MTTTFSSRCTPAAWAIALLAVACVAAGAQEPTELPFGPGERLVYEARARGMLSGRAELWVEGPVDVRGVSALLLRFSFNTKIGPLGVSDETWSWIDPARMATLRYEKYERRLLARHAEAVEMDASGEGWHDADGRRGTTASRTPLDELSFIYALRTLALPLDSTLRLDRHFDAGRNPTLVRFLGYDTLTTPAGTFVTREVEMRVRDVRHYRGEGVIRLSFSDDPCRRPVRIVSEIPDAGRVVLTLVGATPALSRCSPRALAAGAP